MKPFKTHRQQIGILRSRGLSVNGSRAIRVLERENYYNVINGYKQLFLVTNQSGHPISLEQYKNGSSFDEIYKLFTFDRELRNIILKYLLIFENDIKSKVSYRFSQIHKEPHAYLQMNNYSNSHIEQTLKLIAKLSNIIANKSEANGPIKHYLDNHSGVPLWVLVNYLTIGNISNFYKVLSNSLKDTIAKDYSLQYKRNYNNTFQITKETIEDVLKMANLFRNVCAHEERLYCFKLHRPPSNRHTSQLLNISQQYLVGNLFTMVALLKLVLPKNNHKDLIKCLVNLFNSYQNSFPSLQFSQVLSVMGFPPNWRSMF